MTILLSVIAFLLLVIVLIMLFGRDTVIAFVPDIIRVLILGLVIVAGLIWALSLWKYSQQ